MEQIPVSRQEGDSQEFDARLLALLASRLAMSASQTEDRKFWVPEHLRERLAEMSTTTGEQGDVLRDLRVNLERLTHISEVSSAEAVETFPFAVYLAMERPGASAELVLDEIERWQIKYSKTLILADGLLGDLAAGNEPKQTAKAREVVKMTNRVLKDLKQRLVALR